MTRLLFVKWPKLLVWHVVLVEVGLRRTVTQCGLPIGSHTLESKTRPDRVCRQCDRAGAKVVKGRAA
jgi:hypothetical protein